MKGKNHENKRGLFSIFFFFFLLFTFWKPKFKRKNKSMKSCQEKIMKKIIYLAPCKNIPLSVQEFKDVSWWTDQQEDNIVHKAQGYQVASQVPICMSIMMQYLIGEGRVGWQIHELSHQFQCMIEKMYTINLPQKWKLKVYFT